MEIVFKILIILGIILFCFLVCALNVASQQSRIEEQQEYLRKCKEIEENEQKEKLRSEIMEELKNKKD